MTIRIAVPEKARAGEILEIKALIRHQMETGFRRDAYGRTIPRDILKEFECLYNGTRVFHAELFPAVAANPFLTFYTRATESGTLVFRWTHESGQVSTHSANIEVL